MTVSHADILGVPVSCVTKAGAVREILGWVSGGLSRFVCVREVHGLMQAVWNPKLLSIHHQAGLVTPDGMPLVWISRRRGHEIERVCGYDLVDALCDASQDLNVRHFFYGGKDGVADRMVAELRRKYPRLNVVGTYSPPFRPMTRDEDEDTVSMLKRSGAQVIWVGIGSPKQEFWMHEHVSRLPGATLIGVGAAFDFHAGAIKRAPRWMQRSGLEWLHRLASEPRRLWYRYLVVTPLFAWELIKERLGNRKPA